MNFDVISKSNTVISSAKVDHSSEICITTISLNGEWKLYRADEAESIPVEVPGCVHSALLAAGVIEDPFFRDNEDGVQWVAREQWIYRRSFEVASSTLESAEVLLCCEGLDTIAFISLNGTLVGSTDNMFRRWEFDAKPFLMAGTNAIEVRFASIVDYIEKRQQVNPMIYPTPARQIAGFSQVRKAAFGFGWDWGPCLPTIGIWQPIYLRLFNTGRLVDVSVQQDHLQTGAVELGISIEAEVVSGISVRAHVFVEYDGEEVDQATCAIDQSCGTVSCCIKDSKLWWPRGMGEQPLYNVRVELRDNDGSLVDTWARRIGLRTFRLETGKDEWGHAFAFLVNGISFFAKGTNWIPADALVSRVTPERQRQLLIAAAEANMNMVRVWGGGIYEPDGFYDICDELGLCVWQDFMFACAPYPLEDPEFLQNTEIEMIQQIKRLRHHASLAVWCGNNEIEYCGFVAINGDARHISLEVYRGFFETKMTDLLSKYSPEHRCWPGSPYKEEGEVYDPNCPTFPDHRGDAHIWAVWNNEQPFEAFRKCLNRFFSEFGFQGRPELASVERFTNSEDRVGGSSIIRHHQRSPSGDQLIKEYTEEWFRQPRDFNAALRCSQIVQGMALKIACEHARRSMPRTMGTLIWQLNDAWPVTSWAGIDYYGQWKAMHFMARRFYSPVLVSAVEDPVTGQVEVHVTSDLASSLPATLQWKLTNLEGHTLREDAIRVFTASRASMKICDLNFGSEIATYGGENLLLWLDLRASEVESLSCNLVFFARPRQLDLPDPKLTHLVKRHEGDTFVVEICAAAPALWVSLEIPGVSIHCSDHFLHLEAGFSVEVIVRPEKDMSLQEFSDALQVRSLVDTYDATS